MIEFSNVSITTDFGEYIRDPGLQSAEIARLETVKELYGTDIRMLGTGNLFAYKGDISSLGGISNLAQALTHRLMTERGTHPMDSTLGIPWSEYLGQTYNSQINIVSELSREIVEEVTKDRRVRTVDSIDVQFIDLNAIEIQISVIPIDSNSTFNIALDIRDR